jgi:PAS domain S-box-containing protein
MTHLLIVEDHEENRDLLKMLLEANGYRVTAAGDGLEALAAARRDRPDAVVSDALMPRMDGFALCRNWMQDAGLRVIPFIFYSATYVHREDERFAIALGAVRYLIKPLAAEVFLGELRTVLQQWGGHAAPAPASPLDDITSHALHESALARKIEDKVAQLEAVNCKLQESEARFRSLAEMSSDFYWESDAGHRFTQHGSTHKYVSTVPGFGQGTHIGQRPWDIPYLAPEEAGWRAHRAVLDAHQPFRNFENSRLGTDGSARHFSISGDPVFDASGRFMGYHGVGADITERIRAEQRLVEAEAQFRGLVEQSIAGTYILQDGKIDYVNPRGAEILGQGSVDEVMGTDPLSWIVEADRSMVAENMRLLLDGEARSVTIDFGVLRRDGVTIQVGVNGARATYRGRPALIGLLQDISEKKRAEKQIERYVAQVENAFMSTVQVVTTLGEMRDPYTAGHQRRVAEIAVAFGAELGFDARRKEGLRVAGYLHDVGKIRIPSEILSKPGKLSPAEFQLVQGHAQASYDVLKDVEFPWPVAMVALQHHERMDGSGYPQGLKGEAILFEARIMAVADVIEAMSSHRPYRAGLGIDAALSEIERGRGSIYDAKVADACVRLFRERRYQLPA